MSAAEDFVEQPDPAPKICPMCGGKNRPTAYRCTDCGEELREQTEAPLSADQKKLVSLTRALAGSYAAITCVTLTAIVFGFEQVHRSLVSQLSSVVSLFIGFGMIFVAVGVALDSLMAIRVGIWLSGIFAVCLFATWAFSPLALFLIPVILQSRRILKLHEKIDHAAEQDVAAGVSENRSGSA